MRSNYNKGIVEGRGCARYSASPASVNNIPPQEFIVERPTNFFPADAFFLRCHLSRCSASHSGELHRRANHLPRFYIPQSCLFVFGYVIGQVWAQSANMARERLFIAENNHCFCPLSVTI